MYGEVLKDCNFKRLEAIAEQVGMRNSVTLENGTTITVGDYCHAHRWRDADPKDPWAVGFVSAIRVCPDGKPMFQLRGDGVSDRFYQHCHPLSPMSGNTLIAREYEPLVTESRVTYLEHYGSILDVGNGKWEGTVLLGMPSLVWQAYSGNSEHELIEAFVKKVERTVTKAVLAGEL